MMPPPFKISLPSRFYEHNPWWMGELRQKKPRLNVEGATMCSDCWGVQSAVGLRGSSVYRACSMGVLRCCLIASASRSGGSLKKPNVRFSLRTRQQFELTHPSSHNRTGLYSIADRHCSCGRRRV